MDDEFDLFWKSFPRKIAKGDARKAWVQTTSIRPTIDSILLAITEARKHWDSPSFIPYPATWLRAERWSDEWETPILKESETKPWHETWEGIKARGLEFNLKESDFEHPHKFKAAVFEAAKRAHH